jgi:hypothetical protein
MRFTTSVVTATGCLESNPEATNSGLWLEENLKHITMTGNMGIWHKEVAEMKNRKYILTELKKL